MLLNLIKRRERRGRNRELKNRVTYSRYRETGTGKRTPSVRMSGRKRTTGFHTDGPLVGAWDWTPLEGRRRFRDFYPHSTGPTRQHTTSARVGKTHEWGGATRNDRDEGMQASGQRTRTRWEGPSNRTKRGLKSKMNLRVGETLWATVVEWTLNKGEGHLVH